MYAVCRSARDSTRGSVGVAAPAGSRSSRRTSAATAPPGAAAAAAAAIWHMAPTMAAVAALSAPPDSGSM